MFASLPPSGAPPKLFPRFTIHARSSGVPASLPPAQVLRSYVHASLSIHASPALPSLQQSSPQSISTLHSQSTKPALWSRSVWHNSPQVLHTPSTLVRRSLQRSSLQAISTLHSSSTLVRRSRLAPSSGVPPKLLPRWSGAPVSLSSAELPPKLFPRIIVHPHSPSAPAKLFPRFTSSTLVQRSRLAPSSGAPATYFYASQSIRARPAIPSHSLQRCSS